MEWHRAQETFVAELANGSSVRVVIGDTLPASNELVQRDMAGTGRLFRLLDTGSDEAAGDAGAVKDAGAAEAAKPAAKAPAPKAAAPRVTGKG
jgi:hypothetical protein